MTQKSHSWDDTQEKCKHTSTRRLVRECLRRRCSQESGGETAQASVSRCTNELRYIHAVEYYLAEGATVCTDLQDSMLSGRSHFYMSAIRKPIAPTGAESR